MHEDILDDEIIEKIRANLCNPWLPVFRRLAPQKLCKGEQAKYILPLIATESLKHRKKERSSFATFVSHGYFGKLSTRISTD